MTNLTRRNVGLLAGAGLMAAGTQSRAQAPTGTITAGEVVDRIAAHIGHPWMITPRDTFKTGGRDSVVHGIATSFGGDLRVLQRANAMGLNMVIVHEPTFYSDQDVINWVEGDPMYMFKREWIARNNIVVWRTHDNWHARLPADGIQTGWEAAMGWDKYVISKPKQERVYKIPPTTVEGLAKYLSTTLGAHCIRIIGDPYLPVSIVAKGGHQLADNVRATTNADCVLIGETREYDSFEYLRDSVISGERKAALIISHCANENEGMREMVKYLSPYVTEVPIKFVPTDDAYWTV